MIINHNLSAMNAQRLMGANSSNTSKSMEKLSSGLRINRAGDDAAGLAISEKMRGQIRGLNQASSNAQDSISMVQTAEGALNETQSILQRMRELSVQSSNDTATDSDRTQMQKEVSQLKSEIDRIAENTEFNTKKLLNGSLSAAKTSQGTEAATSKFGVGDIDAVGAMLKAGDTITNKEAITAVEGTGYSQTGGLEVSERTTIKDGVNSTFDITVNGTALADVKIADSADGGYSRTDFAKAVQDAINANVGVTEAKLEKVNVSITSDNKLQITSAETGRDMTFTVAKSTTTSADNALSAMGFQATDRETGITGLDVNSASITFGSATTDQFELTVGSTKATIDLGFAAGDSKTGAEIVTAMNSALDTKFGTGNIVANVNSDGKIVLSTKAGLNAATLTAADGGTGFGATTLFGSATANATEKVSGVANVIKAGTSSTMARGAGSVIANNVNDQFNISVNGGDANTITLKAGTYTTKQDLVNEVNSEINSNKDLVGKVKASLDSDGKIKFESATKGLNSSVVVAAPSTAARSALGALGLAGSAGNIDVATNGADIKSGHDLITTATDTKTTVTLGNKSAIIDLSKEKALGINTNGVAEKKSSRDAIVKALQSQLDKAFGANAITVSTTIGTKETLKFTVNAGASNFEMKDAAGQTFVKNILGDATQDTKATVSPTLNNTAVAGADAIKQTLDTSTKLSDLVDKDGNNLGLTAGNVIKFSGTQNGSEIKSTDFTVTNSTTVGDLLNSMRNTPELKDAVISLDATNGTINITGAAGAKNDLSNMKLSAQKSATDTSTVSGFNRMFGSVTVTQEAQDAASDSSLVSHIGANQGQTMNIDINEMSTKSLKLGSIDISTQTGAETAISVVNNALEAVSSERAKLGAFQNRLEHTINNLGTSSENLTASESRIRDVDMAKEMTEYSKNNILSQASQAMLAQAKSQPEQVLQLLR